MTHRYLTMGLLIFVLLQSACDRNLGPEQALRSFIDYRFGKNQDRAELLNFLAGDLYSSLESMPEEQLRDYLSPAGLSRRKFKIDLKTCTEGKCSITYTLSYDVYRDNKKAFIAEVKKIADMELSSGFWKIADVTNIKTHYESIEELTPEEFAVKNILPEGQAQPIEPGPR